ncbi:MAG: hypothetical protein ACK5IN_03600 [Microbacterium sp.]|uniref:hypothetical protein n=1 Tax=Microbacterium sp. TaxID=51671 RepID=UPI003A855074
MTLPSGSAITANQLASLIGEIAKSVEPPVSIAAAIVSSMESTSTYERGCVNSSLRGASPPPEMGVPEASVV